MTHSFKFSQFLKALILSAFVITGGTSLAFAQMGTNVLFQGNVIEQKSKAPVEIKYEIKSSEGQIIRGKSLKDGTFQQVLKPGGNYTISFTGKNIYRAPEALNLRPSEKYYEENRTFAVASISAGQTITAMNLFKTGSAEMNTEERDVLKRILSGVKNEDIQKIVISVAGDPAVKPVKGAKKQKKAPANRLVKDRIAALTEVVSGMGEYVSEKVTIAAEKGKTTTNVSIKAGK